MDYYSVKRKNKFLWVFPFEQSKFSSSHANHIGLYMWGKNVYDYNIYKNDVLVDLSHALNTDNIINILEKS
jgi:hypothetical protein